MVARRTDARRRRVLSEEFVPTEDDLAMSADSVESRPMQAYSFGANRRNQPKTTDLIPKRALSLSLFFVCIATLIAGLNAFAWYRDSLEAVVGETGAASLSLVGNGTLANWLCCVSLFLCSGVCVQLYLLRQHKRDDYGGMYRVWILMAIMFVFASMDCVLDLRTMAAKVFEYATHRSLLQTPWLMMTIEMIVLGLIVLRVLFEVRASKASIAFVTAVWLCFVSGIVLRNSSLPAGLGIDHEMAYGNSLLAGCVGTLTALTVYTRFVFLNAHGLIAVKAKAKNGKSKLKTAKPKSKSKVMLKKQRDLQETATTIAEPKAAVTEKPAAEEPAADQGQTSSVKSKSKSKTSSSKKKTAPAKPSPPAEAAADDRAESSAQLSAEEDPSILSMSKTERRRQRKLAKRAARKAA
jgi:hypothetical protein